MPKFEITFHFHDKDPGFTNGYTEYSQVYAENAMEALKQVESQYDNEKDDFIAEFVKMEKI